MSLKNPLEPRPWNPGCGMTPAQWHRLESNRIEAYRRKQRRSTFPFPGQQYAPPPAAFAGMFNPPVPYGTSMQPALLNQNQFSMPAPTNPYQNQRLPLANLSNIHPQPASGGSPPRKKSPIITQSQNIVSSSSDDISLMPDTSKSKSSNESTTKHPKVWHEGFQFTFHKRLKEGNRYRCCSNRSVTDCDIVLKVLFNGDTIVTGSHGTGCARRNGKKVNALPVESNDCTEQMHQWVEERSTHPDHLHDPPSIVIRDCITHFTNEVGSNFHGMEKQQIRNLVYHSRERIFGSNAISTVETKYSGNDRTAFLRHSSTFPDKEKMQRMMVFSLPCLLNLLMYPMVSITLKPCFPYTPAHFSYGLSFPGTTCLLMPPLILYPTHSTSALSS